MDNITTNELKTAIAYYRYSSHRQGEQSIEGQRAAAEHEKSLKDNLQGGKCLNNIVLFGIVIYRD